MEYKDYIKIICPYCKNRNKDICDIRKTIDGVVRCLEYELDKELLIETYEKRDDLKYDISRNARNRSIIQKREMAKVKKA